MEFSDSGHGDVTTDTASGVRDTASGTQDTASGVQDTASGVQDTMRAPPYPALTQRRGQFL